MDDSLLIIFIKNPQKGAVKTRLAKTIGAQKALQVYHQLLFVTKEATVQLGCDRQVWYSQYVAANDIWSSGGYKKRVQRGNDLGERMQLAFKKGFGEGYEKVVIIGSDCAEISQQILAEAFLTLNEQQTVIGPSRDGGYYLLGMTAFYPDLFSNIPWSTSSVYEQTVSKVKRQRLSLGKLPILNDIDTEQDLNKSSLEVTKE